MAKTTTKPNGGAATEVTRVGGIEGERLRSFVERIEYLEGDIKELNADKSEVYNEAKGYGFDLKVLRKLIAWRRLDRDEQIAEDELLDLYKRIVSGDVVDAPAGPTPPNEQARAAGRLDALSRTRQHASEWPPGMVGHADYALGYQEGERERDAPRARDVHAREAPAPARDAANGAEPPPPITTESGAIARADGYEDGLLAVRDHAARWDDAPGSASYAAGQIEGQLKRAEVIRSGAEAGRRGDEAETCPYPAGSAEAALWQANWMTPDPGKGHPAVPEKPAPKRRARKATASQAAAP